MQPKSDAMVGATGPSGMQRRIAPEMEDEGADVVLPEDLTNAMAGILSSQVPYQDHIVVVDEGDHAATRTYETREKTMQALEDAACSASDPSDVQPFVDKFGAALCLRSIGETGEVHALREGARSGDPIAKAILEGLAVMHASDMKADALCLCEASAAGDCQAENTIEGIVCASASGDVTAQALHTLLMQCRGDLPAPPPTGMSVVPTTPHGIPIPQGHPGGGTPMLPTGGGSGGGGGGGIPVVIPQEGGGGVPVLLQHDGGGIPAIVPHEDGSATPVTIVPGPGPSAKPVIVPARHADGPVLLRDARTAVHHPPHFQMLKKHGSVTIPRPWSPSDITSPPSQAPSAPTTSRY